MFLPAVSIAGRFRRAPSTSATWRECGRLSLFLRAFLGLLHRPLHALGNESGEGADVCVDARTLEGLHIHQKAVDHGQHFAPFEFIDDHRLRSVTTVDPLVSIRDTIIDRHPEAPTVPGGADGPERTSLKNWLAALRRRLLGPLCKRLPF